MNFGSDNMGPVHPRVMDALAAANEGYAMPYGTDTHTARAVDLIRAHFEAPDAEVFFVPLGTAANALALSTLVAPWQAIYCSRVAHIHTDECGAPELFSGGAKLQPVDEVHGRMTPDALEAAITEGADRGVHDVAPGAVSLTQVTECGTVYALEEIAALAQVARSHGLPVHLDGARFANAVVTLGCTPAEMTWKAGVDVVSFGGTKNGLMGAEAVVFFHPEQAAQFAYRRKRGAQLLSKGRYLGAQMAAYLDGDLWRDLAEASNTAAHRLARGMTGVAGASFIHPPQANLLFVSLPRAAHRQAIEAGANYFLTLDDLQGGAETDAIPARLVCDWSASHDDIDRLIAAFAG